MVDATIIKAVAERVRRQTRNQDILSLCDFILTERVVMPDTRSVLYTNNTTPPVSTELSPGACPICEARKKSRREAQARWRAKKGE